MEGKTPARPDQSRDDLELAIIDELAPALNQFVTDLTAYLMEYQRSLTAAGDDAMHLQKAALLWSNAVRTALPDTGTTPWATANLPVPLREAIIGVVRKVTDNATNALARNTIRRALLAPSRDFVESLARTEATTRWNRRYYNDAKRSLDLQRQLGELRPTAKRWVAVHDDRTRHSHAEADGQVVFLNDPFLVNGHAMKYPGDPAAPAGEVVNCRCVMEIFQAEEAEVMKLLLASGAEGATWTGTLVFENEVTGDGRLIETGALHWDEGGVPLRSVSSDVGGHDGAVVVGRITEITRADNGAINATGFLDLGSEHGVEAQRLMAAGLLNGVSVDLDDVSFEIRVAKDLLAEDDFAADDSDSDMETLIEVKSGDELMVIKSARIRAATIVAIPAFANARIDLDDSPATSSPDADAAAESDAFVIVASANDDAPPAEWFTNPNLTAPTPITVTDDGKVFGHIATWGTEHIGRPGTTPPHSATDYKYFHTGAVLTDDGQQLAVGRLTVGTGHADENAAPLRALAHYDNSGTAVADVRAGEDAHGIWVSGAVRPTATGDQIRELRASPPSGDWRRIGGSLELVGVLCVNVPGFPVPRGLVASGYVQSFIAATGPVNIPAHPHIEGLSEMVDDYLRIKKRRNAAVLASARRVRNRLTLEKATELHRKLGGA